MISEITSVWAQVRDADRSRVSSAVQAVQVQIFPAQTFDPMVNPRQRRGNEGDDAAAAPLVRPCLDTKELSE
jgi:hypothetical protein